MAQLENLIASIEDSRLRSELSAEIKSLKTRTDFGLVYERHLPETVCIDANGGLRIGDQVRLRTESTSKPQLVTSMTRTKATLLDTTGSTSQVARSALSVVRRFGEPIYPTLASMGTVIRSDTRPFHTVINGENYHALQMLLYTSAAQFDCIYIDPPYNTGARDWQYNNHYVDSADTWRHSKWLSFMAKRLWFAGRLLKPDGILVISIDENEHAHLVCLLEQVFRGWDITSVTIVHNPRGIQGDNFSVTNDFAVFVTPPGAKVIALRQLDDDAPRETRFRVWGDQSERTQGRNCFFPIYVEGDQVVGFGDVPPAAFHPQSAFQDLGDGRYAVWPIDNAGTERKWRNERKTIESVRHLLRPEWSKGKLQIRIDKDTAAHKTVWTGARYDAGSHGRRLLTALGVTFDYPKSLYTMRDILFACTGNRLDATILDYFAGSGTTLHAACLLNAEDGGSRRCVLVTNNEVAEKPATALNKQGFFPGDPSYEARGIFESVTVPRCIAAITGRLPDGSPVAGSYDAAYPRSAGFEENCEFFHLDYLSPDAVELGTATESLHPLFWLAAGSRSVRPAKFQSKKGFMVAESAGYAVLFDADAFSEFVDVIADVETVTHVFLVTDYNDTYAAMTGRLQSRIVEMVPREYLGWFARATEDGD